MVGGPPRGPWEPQRLGAALPGPGLLAGRGTTEKSHFPIGPKGITRAQPKTGSDVKANKHLSRRACLLTAHRQPARQQSQQHRQPLQTGRQLLRQHHRPFTLSQTGLLPRQRLTHLICDVTGDMTADTHTSHLCLSLNKGQRVCVLVLVLQCSPSLLQFLPHLIRQQEPERLESPPRCSQARFPAEVEVWWGCWLLLLLLPAPSSLQTLVREYSL